MEYLRFVFAHRQFLTYGVALACFSSFGQTFFIALYGAELRAEFNLTHGELGLIYSSATLVSGLTMFWLGRFVDSVDLKLLSIIACLGLALACLAMALTPAAIFLYGAFFLLRLSGQGMMTHTAITSIARHFGPDRGKAVSIVSLGLPLGEAIFPLSAVLLMALVGWRVSWIVAALLLAFVVTPAVAWLLASEGAIKSQQQSSHDLASVARDGRIWSRRDVLRDRRFYLIVPAVMASSYVTTGLFFHQTHLAEAKGWSLAWLATCFVGYALSTLIAALAVGPMVDRLGAHRLLPWFLLPLGLGLVILGLFTHPLAALGYMTLVGVGAGASYTIVNALWAEVYGVTHLGAIRSLVFSLTIIASALSPVSLGWLIDLGVDINTIVAGCLVYIVLSIGLLHLAVPRDVPHLPKP